MVRRQLQHPATGVHHQEVPGAQDGCRTHHTAGEHGDDEDVLLHPEPVDHAAPQQQTPAFGAGAQPAASFGGRGGDGDRGRAPGPGGEDDTPVSTGSEPR